MNPLRLAISPVIALACLGCTHNDGNIGPWFGAWAMPSMTVDGTMPDNFNPSATVWEFQSDLLRISLLGEHNTVADVSWGTWHEADGHLYLDFTHANGDTGSEYCAPVWLLMEPDRVADLTIVERASRRMVLQYTTGSEQSVTYTLKKTW